MLKMLEPHSTSIASYGNSARFRRLLSLSGILGCIALIVYFSAPFVIFPFPSSSASASQIISNATKYQLEYMMAAWLQGTGAFLIVIFVVGLVYVTRLWENFASWITFLASAVIVMLSLNEGTYFIDVSQAVSNGHPEAAVTSFDLTFVFLHSFFIAPSLLLPLAFVLRRSTILPKIFWKSALLIGAGFESMGLFGVLFPQFVLLSVAVIVLMVAWIISASAVFAFKSTF
jgi:hypothetical protein